MDMWYGMPAREHTEKKRLEKRTNYRQFAFQIRERRPGFNVKVVLLVINAFSGGIKEILKELKNVWKKWFVWKDRGRNAENNFDEAWHYHSESAVRAHPKWLNKFMTITALSKGLTNYLMVAQFGYMIWIGSIAIIL